MLESLTVAEKQEGQQRFYGSLGRSKLLTLRWVGRQKTHLNAILPVLERGHPPLLPHLLHLFLSEEKGLGLDLDFVLRRGNLNRVLDVDSDGGRSFEGFGLERLIVLLLEEGCIPPFDVGRSGAL